MTQPSSVSWVVNTEELPTTTPWKRARVMTQSRAETAAPSRTSRPSPFPSIEHLSRVPRTDPDPSFATRMPSPAFDTTVSRMKTLTSPAKPNGKMSIPRTPPSTTQFSMSSAAPEVNTTSWLGNDPGGAETLMPRNVTTSLEPAAISTPKDPPVGLVTNCWINALTPGGASMVTDFVMRTAPYSPVFKTMTRPLDVTRVME